MENNILFDFARIKCELYFLNKSAKYKESEAIKAKLDNEFSSIIIQCPPFSAKKDKHSSQNEKRNIFIQYYERGDIVNDNMMVLSK